MSFLSRAGFAALSDIDDPFWKEIFDRLAAEQAAFLLQEGKFRSQAYRWPRDALHNWSRIWEYPYVYYHVDRLIRHLQTMPIQVVDYGSGVTFFPFSLASMGCNVTCVDVDPICVNDIPLANAAMAPKAGNVVATLLDDGRMPLADESQDVVICVSVLEHLDNYQQVIDDVWRVLKRGGKFIVTFDVDLRGNAEIGASGFAVLISAIEAAFERDVQERPVHPNALLTTANSPLADKRHSPVFIVKQIVREALAGRLLTSDPRVGTHLAVYSGVFIK